MDEDLKAPVADELPPGVTEAEQRAEDSAPASAVAPDLTALEALKQGAEAWNQWRESHPEDTPDLSDTDLAERDLGGADLRGVSLRDADLSNADLSGTKGLSVPQLAGAVLAEATLPKEPSTENAQDRFNLLNVEEASRNARKLFLSMLLVCAYTLLTVATTTDAALVTNSGTSPLPIVGSRIRIVDFYIVTPVLLLGFYFYFHLYAQRLWENLGVLPAVLPDGRRLDKAVYPWLLNGLVTAHCKRLRKDLPPFFRLQYGASLFAAWGVVPVTILVLWGRYLTRQHTGGALALALVLVVCLGLGLGFYQMARSTLRGGLLKIPAPGPFDLRQTLWEFAGWAALTFFGLFVFHTSYEAAQGSVFGFSLSANFERQDVSIKPAGWEWEDLRLVQGAQLAGRNLRNAKAEGAFLAKANLQATDLTGADLRDADLRGANLEGATLDFADLRGATLQNGKGAATTMSPGQISRVLGDKRTKLPEALAKARPSNWDKPLWKDVPLPPAGAFQMGCVGEKDPHCNEDEKRHRVEITKPYQMRTTEVTVAEYSVFAYRTGNPMPSHAWPEPDRPVVNVDWYQAKAYCEWTGGRLPTEAEWEYAARGGLPESVYPWGDEEPDDTRTKFGFRGRFGPVPVGGYSPNDFGLHDIAGNVWEWTADWYGPYGEGEDPDPKGPDEGEYKTVRGGSWINDFPRDLRCSVRYWGVPDDSYVNVGFRCVREVSP